MRKKGGKSFDKYADYTWLSLAGNMCLNFFQIWRQNATSPLSWQIPELFYSTSREALRNRYVWLLFHDTWRIYGKFCQKIWFALLWKVYQSLNWNFKAQIADVFMRVNIAGVFFQTLKIGIRVSRTALKQGQSVRPATNRCVCV